MLIHITLSVNKMLICFELFCVANQACCLHCVGGCSGAGVRLVLFHMDVVPGPWSIPVFFLKLSHVGAFYQALVGYCNCSQYFALLKEAMSNEKTISSFVGVFLANTHFPQSFVTFSAHSWSSFRLCSSLETAPRNVLCLSWLSL